VSYHCINYYPKTKQVVRFPLSRCWGPPPGGGGPIRGSQSPLAGFSKTQSHALRRTSFCSNADKLVSQLAGFQVGDLPHLGCVGRSQMAAPGPSAPPLLLLRKETR
jgi:hypothetical protein